MKAGFGAFCVIFICTLATGQTKTCDSFSATTTGPRIPLANTAEHSSGLHSWGVAPIYTCTYTHSAGTNCATDCKVDFSPGFISSETGTLTAAGTHEVSGGWEPGQSHNSSGGASCSGTQAAAASNCFLVFGKCVVGVTIQSGGISATTNGHMVWTSAGSKADNNCAPLADPENVKKVSDGTGGVPPDPCLNSATVNPTQGPTGDIMRNGGGTPGDPTCSPIIIDTEGEGFHLTSATNGVMFDIRGDGHPIKIAWTAPGSHNAFLALDRDGTGTITSGKELFGNFTAQPASAHPNGFLALAEFDKPENGGNGDGVIDAYDAVYSKLRLWIDVNHDGVAQRNEVYRLDELGVYSLALNYRDSRREDQYGNQFRYKARVNPGRHDRRDDAEVGRWTYDVFFVTQ